MMEWEILIKVVGVVLVFMGSISYGLYLWKEWDDRCKELEDFKQVFIGLSRDQAYTKEPLPYLFMNLFKDKEGIVAEKTRKLGEVIMEMPFNVAWETYVLEIHKELKLGEGMRGASLRLGEYLQGMDSAKLQLQLQNCLELLEEEIVHRRTTLREKKKVGMSCCIMVGLFAIIILI